MQIKIHHSLPGRLRIHYNLEEVSSRQSVLVQTLIAVQDGIIDISGNPIIGSFLIFYDSNIISQEEICNLFKAITDKYLEDETLLNQVAEVPIQESLTSVIVKTAIIYFLKKLLPPQLQMIFFIRNLLPRIFSTIEQLSTGNIFSTDLLDTTAITAAYCNGKKNTASSISTLLTMGEQIEEITRRQSYNNLANTLLTFNEDVHLIKDEEEILIPATSLKQGDIIVVRQNSVIPADGIVEKGEGLVNQASITGESLPVEKNQNTSVFAGTVLEEGELYIKVLKVGKNTKVQNIIQMIDNSQNLKAQAQKRSERLAEKIVPLNFLLTGLTYFLTRDITKTISTLMVDYSCAMKLVAPITVLSAMKEAASYGISVKGGKYLEEAALADTVIFDKTGTLTYATPVLESVFPMKGFSEKDILKWAACLEEHYPHPLGRAVVKAAEEQKLKHPEEHTKVDYIVAHGISSTYEGKKIIIGSAHFIFEDEKIPLTEEVKKLQKLANKNENSMLYLAYDGKLAGIITIGDPIREESKSTINTLHKLGIKNCVMITGDGESAAKKVAKETNVDAYISQALPEDKVNFVENQKAKNHKVIMIGDGINDAPALSAANVGIAVDGCSSIAGDTADIEINNNGLENLVVVRKLGDALINKIGENNAKIIGINSFLLLGGIFGFIPPTLSAILHNSLTIALSIDAMKPLLPNTNYYKGN